MTTSSCSWPASRDRRTASWTSWWKFTCEALEKFLAAVGPYIDIVLFGDDLGMQSGPQISPAMYREYLQAAHNARCGSGPSSSRPSRSCCTAAAASASLLARPHRRGAGRHQPRADYLRGHGRRGPQARLREPAHVLGRRMRHPRGADLRDARTIRDHVRRQVTSGSPAAASSSSRSTTSWPTCLRRTSWRCSTLCDRRRMQGCAVAYPALPGLGHPRRPG